MLKNLLTSVFVLISVLSSSSFAGQDCYGGGADVNDSQKKEMKDKEA
tara:strand:- start:71 stop:211 length:141 start_codon:yes stop_codon:yes gene_type:complete